MLGLLIGIVWDYSRYIRLGDFILTNQDDCGNLDVRATLGGVSLGIKDGPQGTFSVDGNVYLPVERWTAYNKHHATAWLHVNFLDTTADFIGDHYFDVKLDLTSAERSWGTPEMRISIPKQSTSAGGSFSWFPLDNYRLGIKNATLRIVDQSNSIVETTPLDFSFVPQLSSGLDAIQATTTHQFMRKTDSMQGNIEDKPYAANECALVISRSGWFLMMAVLLGVVLLTPAVLLSYKRDSDAGLELIAAIIGVATIRTAVLGAPNGWNFLPIDVFFAFIVVLTAAIPLWRLGRRGAESTSQSTKE
ncbi:hypothetical protein [Paraburkholderia bannensis]|uniref:hypothetical protein n=1 Tax=Paraburkholderia bannensis TaxID=765414 RepID=UPI002AC34C94|nr:hypothetical protein [Paraburkholderia bannensis]